MRMYLPRFTFLSFGLAILHVMDRISELAVGLTFGLYQSTVFAVSRTADYLMPMSPEVALASGVPLRPTRDIAYLTTGLHRKAQPRSRLGDPNDEDGGDGAGDDQGGEGEDAISHRLRA